MKNTARIKNQNAGKPATAQAATPPSEDDGIALALVKDGVGLAVIDFTPEEFSNIQSKAEKAGQTLGEFLLEAAIAMASARPVTPKIPKGFVMINLSSHEQKELIELTRKSGEQLRNFLRIALISAKSDLEERVKLRRITGKSGFDLFRFFAWDARLN